VLSYRARMKRRTQVPHKGQADWRKRHPPSANVFDINHLLSRDGGI
jgi:hypothetical protein